MREIISLNENWTLSFPKGDHATEQVNLPHTWNAVDGNDGNGSYLRTTGVYTRTFTAPKQPREGGRTYVEVLAAALNSTVKVNGQVATTHEGGFSIFRADVTDLCHEGENELTIEVSNEDTPSMYPSSADFTFYGGLYRGVNLISVPDAHFDLDYYGGPGMMVTPVPTEDGGANFTIKSFVTNPADDLTVMYSIEDCFGREVASAVRGSADTEVTIYVPDAQLWSMDEPNLYTVIATLQRNNEEVDEIAANVGVRSFKVTPDEGFSINGVPTPLRGVSRHQDRVFEGNALTAEEHYDDAMLIKELGANTIRLAHYQHSQDFYDACDEIGFAVWAEIPFISVFKKGEGAHKHVMEEMKELIIQNYNHPSIMFWGISNEILIGGISQELVDTHHDLEKLCKELDPTRLTTIAHVSTTPVNGPMHHITDLESYNHYFGWYGGQMEQNGPWLDQFHAEHPDICIGISEYGCEGIINWHSNTPQCKDYTEEYQALYHEHMAQVFEDRPWVWASHVWNMFDFGCAARNEGGVSGRNNKGLITMDRKTKKDSYFVYQAYWTQTPMVHIAGRRHAQRAGETTEIKVYSNQDTVVLYVNGKEVGQQTAHRVFKFNVALNEGFNTIVAVAGDVKDSITLEKVAEEPGYYTLPEFNERQEGVANWFKQVGSMDLTAPMEFPEGYYSVKDTMEDLAKNEEALALAAKAVKLATNFDIKPGVGMWDMMKKMTPEAMSNMISGMPEGFIESLNAQLIKVKK
ncbi:glycoside hydrolase family 2 protein [Faecalibacterium prausnitzii]|uniref:Beta-galactosidase n=1 Tax=Faecalibacterium prausnitzii TaxID=853 RepID=A0A2A7APR6_9FIRM|nr:glycoside hydrolase family 2 TIM barrel-domain containing protein [Faecalibacterium prausnitzii]PDX81127.1 beta-galactosidase [Faecalibacterium prausnitzii]